MRIDRKRRTGGGLERLGVREQQRPQLVGIEPVHAGAHLRQERPQARMVRRHRVMIAAAQDGPASSIRLRQMSLDADVQTRITVALPPLDERARERAAEQDWDLTRLDPQDPDERSVLIRLAHPDLDDAIDNGHDELVVDGTPMNPRLHLAIHEVVAAQIIDNDPPEVLATAQRLLALGRDTHEVLHMLGSAVTEQIWTATHEQRSYDRGEHMRALTALPGSWDSRFAPRLTMRPHGRRSRHR